LDLEVVNAVTVNISDAARARKQDSEVGLAAAEEYKEVSRRRF
jgi:hypothetical protein